MPLLAILSIIYVIYRLIREVFEKPIPAENWENKELYHQDIMNGVPIEKRLKYAKQGRYCIPKEITEAYPNPHRDPNSKKIIIENNELYKKDYQQYGGSLVNKWKEQGKYNLNTDELRIIHLQFEVDRLNRIKLSRLLTANEEKKLAEIRVILAARHWNYNNSEACKKWRTVHEAECKLTMNNIK